MESGSVVRLPWRKSTRWAGPVSVPRKRRDSTAQGYPVWLRPARTRSVQRRAAKNQCPGAAQGQAPRHPEV